MDGAYIGTTPNRRFICVTVEPGKHEIAAELLPSRGSATVEVVGGSETYIAVHLSSNLGSSKPQDLELVSETDGVREISRLHLIEN